MAGGMSGFDVAEWVRVNRSGIRLLLTSGFAGDAGRSDEADAVGVRILNKPYSLADLGRALRQTFVEE
jgi:hypothetical protein